MSRIPDPTVNQSGWSTWTSGMDDFGAPYTFLERQALHLWMEPQPPRRHFAAGKFDTVDTLVCGRKDDT